MYFCPQNAISGLIRPDFEFCGQCSCIPTTTEKNSTTTTLFYFAV